MGSILLTEDPGGALGSEFWIGGVGFGAGNFGTHIFHGLEGSAFRGAEILGCGCLDLDFGLRAFDLGASSGHFPDQFLLCYIKWGFRPRL